MPLKILSFILSLLEQVFPESWAAPYKTVRLHRYVKKQKDQPTKLYVYCTYDCSDSSNHILGADSGFYWWVINPKLLSAAFLS